MRKILLPTDFSRNAWNAIAFASELFKDESCLFYLLHTYTPAFYRMDYLVGGPTVSALPDRGVNQSVMGLEKTLEEVDKKLSNPKHHYKMVSAFNLLTDEINQISEREGIELVVMGTQGATGAREIFLGSNTVYVLRKSDIPVLAVPEDYAFQPIQRILFPTDYWTRYKKEELQLLIDLAVLSKAEIDVFHVKEEYDLTETQEDIKAYIRDALQVVPHILSEKRGALMPHAVMDYLDQGGFELLVMMNRKHSFLERLMWRQNVDQIGFHVKVPFLAIRDTARISK